MKITVDTANVRLFECLSSCTRIKIVELLRDSPKNMCELARLLNISSSIITRHVSMLEKAGIVGTVSIPGKRGLQKICSLLMDEITLSFQKKTAVKSFNTVSIPIGQYAAYEVHPTCGLASVDGFIGICDDPRYFSDPGRTSAALLWFGTGWVEYRIPSYLISSLPVHAIEISLEICSEFPGHRDDWPSDIHFYINGILLGVWTSPGDFGRKKGIYTPGWWKAGTQYGLLKTIRLTDRGTLLDGISLSCTAIGQIPIRPGQDLSLRIAVPADALHPGGVNILGRGFGNYDQDIEVRVEYE